MTLRPPGLPCPVMCSALPARAGLPCESAAGRMGAWAQACMRGTARRRRPGTRLPHPPTHPPIHPPTYPPTPGFDLLPSDCCAACRAATTPPCVAWQLEKREDLVSMCCEFRSVGPTLDGPPACPWRECPPSLRGDPLPHAAASPNPEHTCATLRR